MMSLFIFLTSQKEFTKLNVKIDCFLEYESFNDNLIKYKCLSCNGNYSNKIDEELKKQFRNTFKLSNKDINEFILLSTKVFILTNIWMNGKSLIKLYSLKKMISIVI